MHHALQPTPGNCGVLLFLIIGIVGTARNQIASQVVGLVGSTLIGYLDRNRTEKGDRTWRARTQQVARLSRRLWVLRRSGSQEVTQRPAAVAPLECIVVIQDLGESKTSEHRIREDSLNGPKWIDPQDFRDSATAPVSIIETDAAEPHAGSKSTLRRRRPHKPQRVHFPERGEDLQSVHLFESDETEAQLEVEETETNLILDTSLTSPIPRPSPSQYANVHLETLQLLPSRPYKLCGSVLVRNMSPRKIVVVRFTLDEWGTTSEMMASYASSLDVLPPPLDGICNTALDTVGWDRFNFQIRLESVQYPRRLADKILWLCVRFTAEYVGTWWDNNNGANYRVVFKKDVVAGEA